MRARRADAAALAALALAVYANTLHADFTFDDQFAVVSNADVLDGARFGSATASPPSPSDPSTDPWDDRPARRASSLWLNDYWGQNLTSDASHKSWRPLTVLTFRLNAAIGGLEPSPPTSPPPHPDDPTPHPSPPRPRPFGFHAVNVLLHALAVLLSHRLLLRLAPALLPDRHPDARRAFAWLAAALLAAHPVRTEAVASVVGRADVLAAAFATLALLAHADRKPWLAAAATAAAALCKETGVTVLAPLAAWDLAGFPDQGREDDDARADDEGGDDDQGRTGGPRSPSSRSPSSRAATASSSSSSTSSSSPWRAVDYLSRLAPPALAAVVYSAARRAATGASTLVRIYREVENPLAFSDDAFSRRLSLAHLHATYAWLTAWPARLSCDWSHACVEPITSAYDARNLLALAAYSASATALIRGAVAPPGPAGSPARARAWVWIASAAPLVPASNVFFYVGTYIAERLLYAPAFGACVLLAEAITRIATGSTPGASGSASGSRSGSRFLSRSEPFFRRRAFSRDAVSRTAAFAALTCACARACARNVAWSTDDSLFAAAERVCPRSAKVQVNLGVLARRRGDWTDATDRFARAKNLVPGYCDPTYWSAITRADAGDIAAAAVGLREAMKCRWTAADAAAATDALTRAVHAAHVADPENHTLQSAWGEVLANAPGRETEAAPHFVAAGRLLARLADAATATRVARGLPAVASRAETLETARAFQRAAEVADEASEHGCDALEGLATTLARLGDTRGAVDALRALVERGKGTCGDVAEHAAVALRTWGYGTTTTRGRDGDEETT